MELIKHTTKWVKGEVLQGKLMLILGLFVSVAEFYLVNSNNDFLNGMIIPTGLILFVLIAYGSMQVIVRPRHIRKVSEMIKENPKLAIKKEHTKTSKDDRLFKILKKVWSIGMLIAIVIFFTISGNYYKGIAIGSVGLFLTLYMLDSILHSRLKIYLKAMKNLI